MEKYYQGLAMIVFMIVATAFLMSNYDSHNQRWDSVTGMVADISFGEITISGEPLEIDVKRESTYEINKELTNEKISSITYLPNGYSDGGRQYNGVYIKVVSGDKNERQTYYQLVTVDGEVYAKTMFIEGKQHYINSVGNEYVMNDDKLEFVKRSSVFVDNEDRAFQQYLMIIELVHDAINNEDTTLNLPEEIIEKEREKKLITLATTLGLEENTEPLKAEEKAINNYLRKNYYVTSQEDQDGYTGIYYDIITGTYGGGYKGTLFNYNSNGDLGIQITEGEQHYYVYKESTLTSTRYYTCANPDNCGEGITYRKSGPHVQQIKEVERFVDEVDASVERAMKDGTLADDYGYTYSIDGVEIKGKMSIRKASYLSEQFKQQEERLKGMLSGYLNRWLDSKLGGWSKGVPAGICANIFGLEYYKEAGWNRVPMNASAYELQTYLVQNSNTVIIEGEKEEITQNMFRYAYSLRLIANQTSEWQTYLYNSCADETSEEQFYDYGSLNSGEFFSYHYAGSGSQDMIFECDKEDCLYDQACVAFTNGVEPVCVSLVHGAGFKTPKAGSEYDCARGGQ